MTSKSMSKKYISKKISTASANAAMFGVPKMFILVWSRWFPWSHNDDKDNNNNKIYDHSNTEQHLEHYYDF
jgi:hypothetical protein